MQRIIIISSIFYVVIFVDFIALLAILYETVLFGDIIYNFPDITKHVLKFEEKRVNILTWSLIYADFMQELLDDFTVDIISGAQARLHKIKSEFKLRKTKFIQ